MGATAEVRIDRGYPLTVNDPELTERMLPTLERVAGDKLLEHGKITGAEDFSYFQREVPGLFLLLGITSPAQVGKAPQNHSPLFYVDEAALVTGVRALAHLTLDYLNSQAAANARLDGKWEMEKCPTINLGITSVATGNGSRL